MDEQLGGQHGGSASSENADALRALAVRLLQERFPGDPDAPSETELIVGALPANLPVEVPLPDGCRIVGSLVRGEHGVSIVLDSEQPAQQVLDFYRERLEAAGWSAPEMPMPGGGFTHAFFANRATYCRSARGPALNIQAQAMPDKPTDVRLDLQTDPRHSPCGQRHRMPHGHDLIPGLAPPANARQIPQGGGGGGDSWNSSATLEAELDLAPLGDHYMRQLEQAGWSRTGEGQGGPLAWSTWSFRDEDGEPWKGLFFIFKRPNATHGYFLYVRVEVAANGPGERPGWVGYSTSTYSPTLRG